MDHAFKLRELRFTRRDLLFYYGHSRLDGGRLLSQDNKLRLPLPTD